MGESKELNEAIDYVSDPYKNFSNNDRIKLGAAQNNTFTSPTKKGKKVIWKE